MAEACQLDAVTRQRSAWSLVCDRGVADTVNHCALYRAHSRDLQLSSFMPPVIVDSAGFDRNAGVMP